MKLVPVLALGMLAAAAPAARAGQTSIGCGSVDVCVVVTWEDEPLGGHHGCEWGPPLDWDGASVHVSVLGVELDRETGPAQAGPTVPTICP